MIFGTFFGTILSIDLCISDKITALENKKISMAVSTNTVAISNSLLFKNT